MALQRGGTAIDDPMAWWDSLSDEVVEFWETMWQIEPWGSEWERHSHQMSILDCIYAATINPNLDRRNRVKPRPPMDFMPPDYYIEPTTKKNDIVAQLDAYVGANR